MEFHEKLQHLRKQKELTQEQLAQLLFVSRTAVSKWESGRGYPNLESLKAISKLFSISIDELLSNDELIQLAETENRANLRRTSGLVFGVLDLMVLAFLFMPLFGQREEGYIRAVTLLGYTEGAELLRRCYLLFLLGIPALGAAELAFELTDHEKGLRMGKVCSLALCSTAILLFALSRQPYVTAFLFLLFVVKVVLILQENRAG